jgi:hypothetical protein
MRRALKPVVTPTDYNVTAVLWVTVITKVSALKFELNPDALPFPSINLALCLAIWKTGLNGLNHIS